MDWVVLSSVGGVEGDHFARVCSFRAEGGGIPLHFYIRRGLEEEVTGIVPG
jgi:hypothetical protein